MARKKTLVFPDGSYIGVTDDGTEQILGMPTISSSIVFDTLTDTTAHPPAGSDPIKNPTAGRGKQTN